MKTSRYATKEFWIALGTFIASGLFLLDVIDYDTQRTIFGLSGQVIEVIFLVLAQLYLAKKYLDQKAKTGEHITDTNVDTIPTELIDDTPCIRTDTKPVKKPYKRNKSRTKRNKKTDG